MPLYSQVTLSQFVTQISSLMDDAESVYWTVPQIQYAVWEALRIATRLVCGLGARRCAHTRRASWKSAHAWRSVQNR